jgi:gluconate kinase
LQSQIDTLEEPSSDEDPITVDVGLPPEEIAKEIIRLLGAYALVSEGPSRG